MYRTTTMAAALATLVVAAPFAAARPVDPGYTAPERAPVALNAPATPTIVVHQTGFDWLDAAIGAAAAGGLVALGGAVLLIARRPREDAEAPLGAH